MTYYGYGPYPVYGYPGASYGGGFGWGYALIVVLLILLIVLGGGYYYNNVYRR
ncbi:hypothetical protein JOC85_001514 [Bacillus mesophilus]|uniref:Sporulation protein YjcZ n=1 Tax=Bacillus mesophilus TaxID=1808955 RepID=A0A6M0Q5R2_9BACI|nr:sporulation protein YjcZ [Bacillus mesophilus]MBM7660742.1 hypothetical protein [Bacillus mesophilus]NEY71711.1 sporulation protein YjcZ [Bacillus mesophilus]